MNIEYINAIPLCKIFDKLKLHPVQQSDRRILYPSPFQATEKHTMEVYPDKNIWLDSSTNMCGGPLGLIADWLEYQGLRCALPDIQKWFRFNIGYPSMQDGIPDQDHQTTEIKFSHQSPILNPVLIKCIEDNGISYRFARKHLRQLGLTNTKTGDEFAALGLKTEEGGWWVYNPYINTFICNKSISVIRGDKYAYRTAHIFKDIFDYMAARLAFNDGEPFDDESIILNSYDCLENSAQYLRGFGYRHLFIWLGNDPTGQQATENYAQLCSIEDNLKYKAMNLLYKSCPDVASWHARQLKQ